MSVKHSKTIIKHIWFKYVRGTMWVYKTDMTGLYTSGRSKSRSVLTLGGFSHINHDTLLLKAATVKIYVPCNHCRVLFVKYFSVLAMFVLIVLGSFFHFSLLLLTVPSFYNPCCRSNFTCNDGRAILLSFYSAKENKQALSKVNSLLLRGRKL